MHVYNIADFGAVPDGKTLVTAAIQASIETASAAGEARCSCRRANI